jgi:hypothetical protein
MKTAAGRQSSAQRDFGKRAIMNGYGYVVCRSVDGFIQTVNDYIKNQITTNNQNVQ